MRFADKIDKARNLIKETLDQHENVALGCSFGKDSMVVLHMARQLDPTIPVFSILAETEFDETFRFRDRVVDEWDLDYTEVTFSQPADVENDVALCCGEAKVDATRQALAPYSAWISGVRATEGITRADFQYKETRNGLLKVNPILDFEEVDVWRYLAVYEVPTNPAYQQGFRSMGCRICSTPEHSPQEPERAGRWRGTGRERGECGIHTVALR